MIMTTRRSLAPGLLAVLLLVSTGSAQQAPLFADRFEARTGLPEPVSDARVFFWGNSAVHHDPGGPEDADVGEPMRAMADFAGLTGCADGDYTPTLTPSMLADRAYPAPSELIPSMTLGPSCWQSDFASSEFSVGVLQDNNFSWGNGTAWGDVAGAVARVAEARTVEPNLQRWFLYSYQPDADDGSGSFMTRSAFLADQQAFNAANQALQDAIDAADPSIELRYIPIGEIWHDLLRTGGLLDDLALAELFVDTAPHQSPTAAQIMGATVFAALYRQPIPPGYAPAAPVDPRIVARWDAIAERIWTVMTTEPLATRVFGAGWDARRSDTFWVAPGGDDANAGTRSAPWGTLAFAVDQLGPGNTLIIDGGTWNTSIALETSGEPGRPIRVIGRNGATLADDGSDHAVRISASHIEVLGLNITGSRGAFLVGDGLYPMNDVCADIEGFNFGLPPDEQEDFAAGCDGRVETVNPVYSDIVIDGATETGGRARIEITGALDSVSGSVEYFHGVDITDEAERVAIRNYEITGGRHGVFADGIEQVRRLDSITLENLYIHGTLNYGIRMPARRGYVATPNPDGAFANPTDGRIDATPVPLRTQSFTNLLMRNVIMDENGYTADPATCNDPEPDGEAYGNALLQGWVDGVVEQSVFRNGPYWGIDCLICDNITYRNNVFSMSQAVRDLPRCYPDPNDPWPVVGLEVNGGTGNRVLNNTFYGFEGGLFLSMFPENFAETEISVAVRNNVFWGNTDAVEVFPPNDILASSAVETFGNPFNPVGGYSVSRVEDWNLADVDVPMPGYPIDLDEPNNIIDPNADIVFVDAEGGDLRIVSPSTAAIDGGQPLSDVTDDFRRQPRPDGTGHDLGAHETPGPQP
ncbi:MAG: hypothetical protein ACLFQ2_06055 [Wenzhouxiangella sp.]